MKKYKLVIEPCHTDNDQIYRSKGHHSVEDFLCALMVMLVSIPKKNLSL